MRYLAPLLVIALGCTEDPPTDEPFVPDLPTGGCGMAAYDWAPMDDMGAIVDWEYLDGFSLDAEQIAGVLAAGGVDAFDPVLFGVRVYRVRYVTQDRGQRIEATGLISFPDVDDDQAFPTVLWTHPTMGFRDECAPSAIGLAGVAANLLVSSQGYAVVAPDYLGMAGWGEPSGRLHPWVVPEPTAIVSLDALRALWAFSDGRLDPPNHATAERRVAAWGASEGGFAALWADRYLGYLPEADWVATLAVVPPTDMVGIAAHGATHFESATAGLAGMLVTNHDWYQGTAPLTDVLVPELAAAMPAGLQCDSGDLLDDATTHSDLFTEAFLADVRVGEADDPWGCYLEQATLRTSAVQRTHDAPVLFVIAENDDLVVGDVERADVEPLCDAGYTLDFVECAGADHVAGGADSLPLQLAWLRDRMAGVALPDDTCTVREPIDCEGWSSNR